MRKLQALILAGVVGLFLTAVPAFAQSNTANVTQTGSNQTAQALQPGAVNVAQIVQFTDNDGPQEAFVTQSGGNNLATINQSQTGTGNTTLDHSSISQTGDFNVAHQTEVAPGYNSGQVQDALQTGNGNTSNQTIQHGYTVQQYVEQSGDYNTARQTVDAGGAGHLTANIWQGGDWNLATQDQTNDNATANITQNGSLNIAHQTQQDNTNGSLYNVSTIFQYGDSNLATQLQMGGSNLISTITQYSNSNIAHTTQNGSNDVATVTQG